METAHSRPSFRGLRALASGSSGGMQQPSLDLLAQACPRMGSGHLGGEALRRVRALGPASIGNVAAGFDVLGAAIRPLTGAPWGDWVEVGGARSRWVTTHLDLGRPATTRFGSRPQ